MKKKGYLSGVSALIFILSSCTTIGIIKRDAVAEGDSIVVFSYDIIDRASAFEGAPKLYFRYMDASDSPVYRNTKFPVGKTEGSWAPAEDGSKRFRGYAIAAARPGDWLCDGLWLSIKVTYSYTGSATTSVTFPVNQVFTLSSDTMIYLGSFVFDIDRVDVWNYSSKFDVRQSEKDLDEISQRFMADYPQTFGYFEGKFVYASWLPHEK